MAEKFITVAGFVRADGLSGLSSVPCDRMKNQVIVYGCENGAPLFSITN